MGAVILVSDISEYTETQQDGMYNTIIMSIIVLVLSVALMFLIVYRVVTRPLRIFTRAARKVVIDGEMDTPIEVNSKDELGELADMYRRLINTSKNALAFLEDGSK